jgi:diguanylate cyclase (GGDEF)-like protein
MNATHDAAAHACLSARPDGTICEVDGAFLAWTGFDEEEVVERRRFRDLLTRGGQTYHETHYSPLLLMQGAVREIAFDVVCADGGLLPVLVSSVLDRDAAGDPIRIRTTLSYARDRHLYERELRRARDDERSARERVERLQRMTARLTCALDTERVASVVTADIVAALDADEAFLVLRGGVKPDGEPQTHGRRSSGPVPAGGLQVWLATPVRAAPSTTGVLYVVRSGIPAVRAAEREFIAAAVEQCESALARTDLFANVARLAGTDDLTGLPNRRAWSSQLAREFARARRTHDPLSLAILDLDHFKRFNDTHGHVAGDRLLRRVATAWSSLLRPDDVLARYGGEEFALLLSGCGIGSAATLVERLRAAIPDDATCSVGIAQWDGAEVAESLFERADRALYAAKNAGRDRVVLAAPVT